ncbi:circularly permuted type 2 ATP-grasp protein [Luteolibacter luteus]|uniref:Circularly permuted type 2 ATP-grasp protein n=1 Tax=Luteolibacter luteus TaxID=2728835 RepID=A0A858RFF8_9BACT|nr:circularly permuted type 2 ATP-grasp protein [Luteolibacter luteus]QJE95341.1 circularly permuted type 2 ATP-grasp protein [Luteolibacter luteus]
MSVAATPRNSLPPGYRRGAWDEMIAADGSVNPSWSQISSWLGGLSPEQAMATSNEVRRLLRENGVTYSVHGAPDGEHRAWQLDAVPWVVSEQDWKTIEAGLIQRAELLDHILTDLHGEQKLITGGWLPPELIHAHRGYLRPCHEMRLPSKRQLILYAADLARGPDGRMWIVNDRTQAPSGFGYVVENRGVMTRAMPKLFHRTGVRRLAGFFRSLREMLESFPAHAGAREPRVVILTPGPQNETYFEHAFLASYLGYALVQGDDLTVRDGSVWLRSLGGLEPVDVIVRRVDAWFSDPLELKEDSQLGVPGLLEAMRAGNVAVVNHPGSGVLENPGLMAFLPGISRHLRGEELILPAAATWWCGEKQARETVLSRLDKMVVKSIHRAPTFGTVFGGNLSESERASLRDRILANPECYVGQEQVGFSTQPCLNGSSIEARRGVLRGFATSTTDGRYIVMPGGLTRIAASQDALVVSSQLGGTSKDTWVQGADTEPFVSLWSETEQLQAEPDARNVPSRSGENLYWTGRYAERAEGTARLLRRAVMSWVEAIGDDDDQLRRHREILMGGLLGVTNAAPIHPEEAFAAVSDEDEVISLLTELKRPGSLTGILRYFRNSAYAVRDLWSPDSWRVIEAVIREWVEDNQLPGKELDDYTDPLNRLILHLTALLGLNLESMTRDAGWRLLDSGRRIERAQFLLSVIRNFLVESRPPAEEQLVMETVLAASDSLVTYRKRYRTHPRLELVLELLLLEPNNARSLLYQIQRLAGNIEGLPRQEQGARLTPEQRLLVDTTSRLRLADISQLVQATGNRRRKLEAFVDQMGSALYQLSTALTLTYFRHADRPHFLRG